MRLPAYIYRDRTIWGLTFRMLRSFLEVVERASSAHSARSCFGVISQTSSPRSGARGGLDLEAGDGALFEPDRTGVGRAAHQLRGEVSEIRLMPDERDRVERAVRLQRGEHGRGVGPGGELGEPLDLDAAERGGENLRGLRARR